MEDLYLQLENLEQKRKSLKVYKLTLIQDIFKSLNVNYNSQHDSILLNAAILFDSKNKNKKSFKIYFSDKDNKHFFSDKIQDIFMVFVDSNLNIQFKQDFENKYDIKTLQKYQKITEAFYNINTQNFDFEFYYEKLSNIINSLININKEIKYLKKEIDEKKCYFFKKEINNVLVPLEEAQSFSIYQELIKKKKHKENIIFLEIDNEYKKIFFRKVLIKIDNTGRNINIHLVNTSTDIHRKIQKSRLREILNNQFYFNNKIIENLDELKFLKQVSDFKDGEDYAVCYIEDLYKFLKPHINAENF